MIITLILIPLVIWKITPKIKAMRTEISDFETKIAELLATCQRQMAPLNELFSCDDAVRIIEKTVPGLSFKSSFTVDMERNMIKNFDFCDHTDNEQSTLDILSGTYNDNPFVFENKLIHKMGTEVYHGYKTIRWTERYRGSDGKMHSRTRTETLHATLVKPKPFYSTQIVLSYCAQGGPELSFTRDATALHQKNEKEIDKYVKKGEKKLKKKTDKALKDNKEFVSMSNTDFEVIFDAFDRDNEVQFRTLFTPLAQTNMVDLLLSKSGFGDDFDFIKRKRTNRIVSLHSQSRAINLYPSDYASYSYDIIEANFQNKNASYFKAVYFDFAPLWAIPIYQESPVHSLDPISDEHGIYSYKECESLLNNIDPSFVAHQNSKTRCILKSDFIKSKDGEDEIRSSAFSYDIVGRVDFVPMFGGDGRMHSVAVPWDDYIPLVEGHRFFVADVKKSENKNIIAERRGVCIYNKK